MDNKYYLFETYKTYREKQKISVEFRDKQYAAFGKFRRMLMKSGIVIVIFFCGIIMAGLIYLANAYSEARTVSLLCVAFFAAIAYSVVMGNYYMYRRLEHKYYVIFEDDKIIYKMYSPVSVGRRKISYVDIGMVYLRDFDMKFMHCHYVRYMGFVPDMHKVVCEAIYGNAYFTFVNTAGNVLFQLPYSNEINELILSKFDNICSISDEKGYREFSDSLTDREMIAMEKEFVDKFDGYIN